MTKRKRSTIDAWCDKLTKEAIAIAKNAALIGTLEERRADAMDALRNGPKGPAAQRALKASVKAIDARIQVLWKRIGLGLGESL